MAIVFHKKYLTTKGKELINKAVTGEQAIVWGKCKLSSYTWDSLPGTTDIDKATSAKALTDISVNGNYVASGTTFSAQKTTPTSISLICGLSNKDDEANLIGGEIHALGIWCRTEDMLESESILVAVAFYSMNGDNSAGTSGGPETVPPPYTELYTVTIEFYILLNDEVTPTVEVSPTYLTPIEAFSKLEERAVTTHSQNSKETGDDQDIYGKKNFKNEVSAASITCNKSEGTLGNKTGAWASIYTKSTNKNPITCSSEASATTKSITVPYFDMVDGASVLVLFSKGNSVTLPKMSVNGVSTIPLYGLPKEETDFIVSIMYYKGAFFTEGFTSASIQISARGSDANKEYPILLSDSVATTGVPQSKSVFTDISSSGITYNPSTQTLTCPVIKGALDGTSDTASTAMNVNLQLSDNDAEYPIVFEYSRTYDKQEVGKPQLYLRSKLGADDKTSQCARYNPYTNTLFSTNFNGNLIGNASTASKALVTMTSDDNNTYPLVFRERIRAVDSSIPSRNCSLYTAPNVEYNPSTNTLHCVNASVHGSLELTPEMICELANTMGVPLEIIDVYYARSGGGETFTLSVGSIVHHGYGASVSSSQSNDTVCKHGTKDIFLTSEYKVTKVISAGVTSSQSNAITLEGRPCANPNYGTACVCLAVKL